MVTVSVNMDGSEVVGRSVDTRSKVSGSLDGWEAVSVSIDGREAVPIIWMEGAGSVNEHEKRQCSQSLIVAK
jgi:hypothetical protein